MGMDVALAGADGARIRRAPLQEPLHDLFADQIPGHLDIELVIDGEAIHFAGVDRPLSRAPLLGEHNEYVLRDLLGLAREEFDALVAAGVVN